MTSPGARFFLIITALILAVAAGVFLTNPPEMGDVRTPPDVHLLGARIARHPADWPAASALTEVSLDARTTNRTLLWHAAYEHAAILAPERMDPPNAYARAAFFHWSELSEEDRQDALRVFSKLLRDPGFFHQMARPMFELTGDLSYLQRSGPPTENTIQWLIGFALPNGRFSDYRVLRGQLQKKRFDEMNARIHTDTPEELVARFPSPPYHDDTEPLIQALLNELHQRPLSENPGRKEVTDAIADYAIRHDLRPLDGLEVITRIAGAASVQTQIDLSKVLGLQERAARIELASHDPRTSAPRSSDWQGLCDYDICGRAWRTIAAQHGIAMTLGTMRTDEIPAYAEIYVDDTLRNEGEVGAKRDFVIPVGSSGSHRIEVLLANPTTRNGTSRRIRVVSLTTL
ncbi:MAG: hypothetical protein QOK37_2056 [Thermoanaerobaculia bacterium]|jgi:hypothetical protein|nr:hypothetical protein [Thermoanaerobaculia bacterium]